MLLGVCLITLCYLVAVCLLSIHREADEGFNACRLCGFENFKRFPFCNVCGEKIPEHESEQQQLKRKKKSSWGSKRSSLKKSGYEDVSSEVSAVLPMEPTQRQQRARFVRSCETARLPPILCALLP